MKQSANTLIKEKIKKFVYPVYAQTKLIERVKYRSRVISDNQLGHDVVRRHVESGIAAIGKIGESELRGLACYLKNRDDDGFCNKWDKRSQRLYFNAGVFPNSSEGFSDFGRVMLDCVPSVDCLAVWFNKGEAKVVNNHAQNAELVSLESLEPFLWDRPWMELSRGKKVLAISPFAKTIQNQHESIKKIWSSKPQMAPKYELEVIETPLSASLVESPYGSWLEGLKHLQHRMEKVQFDIAIIGAGAWSLPLAVHAKRLEKVGVHLGGGAQLVFGILGKRWENRPKHAKYFNEYWTRPGTNERPESYKNLENGCYW